MSITIGQTHRTPLGLRANCLACHRAAELDLAALLERFGAARQIHTLPIVCSRCGSRRWAPTVHPLDEGRRRAGTGVT